MCSHYLFKELLVELINHSYGSEDSDREQRKWENEGKYVAGGAWARPCHHRDASPARFSAAQLQNSVDRAAAVVLRWRLVGDGDKARKSGGRK